MDLSIEEYKTLRTEILRNFEAKERNLIACITANGAALVYGLKDAPKDSQIFVLILATLIPIYFWIKDTSYRNNIAKIASYIATYLEAHDVNLMWENRVREIDLKQKSLLFRYIMITDLTPYPIILSVSIAVTIFNRMPYISGHLTLIFFLCIIFLIYLLSKYIAIPYTRLREPWIEAWGELKKSKRQSNSFIDPNID